MSTDRDGVVRFGDFGEGGSIVYTPPVNTMDPRYAACTDHHVACDCREAEHAEYRMEAQADRATTQAAIDAVLDGHPTRVYDDNAVPCQCTGCQIARAGHFYHFDSAVAQARRERDELQRQIDALLALPLQGGPSGRETLAYTANDIRRTIAAATEVPF